MHLQPFPPSARRSHSRSVLVASHVRLSKSQMEASCSCQPPKGLFHVPLSRKHRHSPAQQSDGRGSSVDSSIPTQSGVLPLDLVPSEWFIHWESQRYPNHTRQLAGQRREGGSCEEGGRESGSQARGWMPRALGDAVNPTGPLLEGWGFIYPHPCQVLTFFVFLILLVLSCVFFCQ